MEFKINEISNIPSRVEKNKYDISALLKKDSVTYSEAGFVLETLCHEVSQENISLFVYLCKYQKNIKNIKKYKIEKNNNFFRIKTKFKIYHQRQIIGVYLNWNSDVLLLGKTLKLSVMLRKLFSKLRIINQERRINFIEKNPELKTNNEQIYLILKERNLRRIEPSFSKEYEDYFEDNIDSKEVSLKQMIGVCERFNLNNKLLSDMKKELVIVQNRRKKKEYEIVKEKALDLTIELEYIDFNV